MEFEDRAGAIDGIRIWILKSTFAVSKAVEVDQQKFMCGRKHKFGLNCQAVGDVHGKSVDISITCGGASSDVVAFEGSDLKQHLDSGLLAPNLVVFGDKTYMTTSFMTAPYSITCGGSMDNYNYFHSQCRIRIECAFGMWVQRWGILRMPMPKNITVPKTISLVLALAKLHNFCIDEANVVPGTILDQDEENITLNENGSVPLVPNTEIAKLMDFNVNTPEDLIGGGQNFEDTPLYCQRRVQNDGHRHRLCIQVENTFKMRPRRGQA